MMKVEDKRTTGSEDSGLGKGWVLFREMMGRRLSIYESFELIWAKLPFKIVNQEQQGKNGH